MLEPWTLTVEDQLFAAIVSQLVPGDGSSRAVSCFARDCADFVARRPGGIVGRSEGDRIAGFLSPCASGHVVGAIRPVSFLALGAPLASWQHGGERVIPVFLSDRALLIALPGSADRDRRPVWLSGCEACTPRSASPPESRR